MMSNKRSDYSGRYFFTAILFHKLSLSELSILNRKLVYVVQGVSFSAENGTRGWLSPSSRMWKTYLPTAFTTISPKDCYWEIIENFHCAPSVYHQSIIFNSSALHKLVTSLQQFHNSKRGECWKNYGKLEVYHNLKFTPAAAGAVSFLARERK